MGFESVAQLLLQAVPAAAMVAAAAPAGLLWQELSVAHPGQLPLHVAAQEGHVGVARLLVAAAPQAAAVAAASGGTPLQIALAQRHYAIASCLLGAGDATAVLRLLSDAAQGAAQVVNWAGDPPPGLPTHLYADFLLAPGRLPLAAAGWALVPAPCPGIERALPAAAACSADQAQQVVQRLPPAAKARLRAAALCLGRCPLPVGVRALILARAV